MFMKFAIPAFAAAALFVAVPATTSQAAPAASPIAAAGVKSEANANLVEVRRCFVRPRRVCNVKRTCTRRYGRNVCRVVRNCRTRYVRVCRY